MSLCPSHPPFSALLWPVWLLRYGSGSAALSEGGEDRKIYKTKKKSRNSTVLASHTPGLRTKTKKNKNKARASRFLRVEYNRKIYETKRAQINSVGWKHTRVDNRKTNKVQASRFCSTASNHSSEVRMDVCVCLCDLSHIPNAHLRWY